MDDKNNTQPLFIDIIQDAWNSVMDNMLKDGKTEDDIRKYIESDSFAEAHMSLLEQMIEGCTKSIEQHIAEYDAEEKHSHSLHIEHMESLWGEGLAWLRQYYSKCADICNGYMLHINQSKIISDRRNTANALRFIQAKAMQVYAEIICLLANGFPYGAYARFRSLYELWAVAEFISSDTDAVAAAYIESSNNRTNQESAHYKWAKESDRMRKSEKITINAIVNEAHKTVKARLKDDVSNRHLTALYTFPNLIIHPSAQGVFGSFSTCQTNAVSIGAIDVGLATPAINSSQIMHNINILFMNFHANEVSIIGLGILRNIIDQKIVPIFGKIEKQFKCSEEVYEGR